jgi:hypothetical protein
MCALGKVKTRSLYHPALPILQNAILEQTRGFLFRGFFVCIFKTRLEYAILFKIRQ